MYRIIRKGELPVSRWSGGTTTQLAIWPEGAVYAERNFVWRVSSARVETQESEFTSLPGVARCLMVLDGTLHLEHEGRYEFMVEAGMPWLGRIVRYEGWLEQVSTNAAE